MKITKQQLKRIIKEEIQQLNETVYQPPGVMGPPSPSVSLEALWRDLNSLLARWTDKEHQYYRDLYYVMEAYSTSPDRPTLPDTINETEPKFGFREGDSVVHKQEPELGKGKVTSRGAKNVSVKWLSPKGRKPFTGKHAAEVLRKV